MNTLELKFLLMVVIFLSTTLVGVSPLLLRGLLGKRLSSVLSPTTRARVLSCATCYSAGVFLFVCFLGLLPAADSKFHLILKRLSDGDVKWEAFSEFPWGFFVVTCGFLSIFTIDRLVHAVDVHHSKTDKGYSSSTSVRSVTLLSIKGDSVTPAGPINQPTSNGHQAGFNQATALEDIISNKLREAPPYQRDEAQTVHLMGNGVLDTNIDINRSPGELHLQLQPTTKKTDEVMASSTGAILDQSTHSHGHGVPSSLIFLVALGIHSLFEGAAVGLQTEREKVLEFGVAVLVHELVMALTFGLEVSRSRRLNLPWQVAYVCLFTGSIPLGIAIGAGTLRSAGVNSREVVAAVMEAVATGIFLHVIFIEIIAKEFPDTHHHQQHHHHQHQHHHHHRKSLASVSPLPHSEDRHHPNYSTIKLVDPDDEAAHGVPLNKELGGGSFVADKASKAPSEVRLIAEKILCICLGLLTLILLNVFMHSHHE